MKLSEQLKQDHESGDSGIALEGYSEIALNLEDNIQELVAENAALKARGEWVSVNDSMPEFIDGNKVLAFGSGYIFEAECEDGYWCNLGGEDMTHWMQLPDKPKDNNERKGS